MKIVEVEINLGNWPSASDVSPVYHADTGRLEIFAGKTKRSGCESVVLQNSKKLTCVVVGWWHKKGGGQQWYFYGPDGSRLLWKQLTTRQKSRALKLHKSAPKWVKVPGVLKPKAPRRLFDCWKMAIRYPDGSIHSLYDATFTYELGARYSQKARPEHGGGLYAYCAYLEAIKAVEGQTITLAEMLESCPRIRQSLKALWKNNGLKHLLAARGVWQSEIVFLRCIGSGPFIEYDEKIAFSHLRPVSIVGAFPVPGVMSL